MEYLEAINETSYLSVPNAQVYRKIMRCFYREYEKMNFQLYKEDVFKVLKEDELFEDYSMDQLVLDLNALVLCLQRSFLIIRTTLTGEQQRDFFLCMPSVSGRNGEPCVVTMENLKDITEAKAIDNQVYVVENEMVFSYLTSSEKKKACTILCTSGQLRSAAVKLLDFLVKSRASVYYSGDTDPDGLGIADRLWQKFQASVHIWRMGPEDYEKSLSGEAVGRFGLAKLEQLKHPVLRETAEYIRRDKKAGYQENLLEELAKDIQK